MIIQQVSRLYSDVEPERARRLYLWLLLLLKSFSETWCPLPVFTTNYDWTWERIAEGLKTRFNKLIDGFTARPMGMIWDPMLFHRLKGSRYWQIVLFKLHGSTSWYQQSNKQIVKITHAENDPGELRSAVIYPVREKSVLATQEPFATPYRYLRACLGGGVRLCVVIGYSFRDPQVNEAFVAGLSENEHLRVLILDPYPDKAGIQTALQADSRKIIFVEDEFRFYGLNRNRALREAIEAMMTPGFIYLQEYVS